MTTTFSGESDVWAVVAAESARAVPHLRLFWHRADAEAAWADHSASNPLIAASSGASYRVPLPDVTKARWLGQVRVHGFQHFQVPIDLRSRCAQCREPIVLEDPDDPTSWVHADDANDWGDHAADHDRPAREAPDGR